VSDLWKWFKVDVYFNSALYETVSYHFSDFISFRGNQIYALKN